MYEHLESIFIRNSTNIKHYKCTKRQNKLKQTIYSKKWYLYEQSEVIGGMRVHAGSESMWNEEKMKRRWREDISILFLRGLTRDAPIAMIPRLQNIDFGSHPVGRTNHRTPRRAGRIRDLGVDTKGSCKTSSQHIPAITGYKGKHDIYDPGSIYLESKWGRYLLTEFDIPDRAKLSSHAPQLVPTTPQ